MVLTEQLHDVRKPRVIIKVQEELKCLEADDHL